MSHPQWPSQDGQERPFFRKESFAKLSLWVTKISLLPVHATLLSGQGVQIMTALTLFFNPHITCFLEPLKNALRKDDEEEEEEEGATSIKSQLSC